MAIKSATYQFKGMNRDLSNINASNLFAYEIRNMKITANEDNTLLSISTNKGTKKTNIELKGTPIGHATIDNEWVIFCAGTKGLYEVPNIPEASYEIIVHPDLDYLETRDIQTTDLSDYIYKITKENNNYTSNHVYGNLNLDATHPIEATTFVENEELKKVYWTDNKNQLRFIRLDRITSGSITSSEVDFIPEVKNSNEIVTITKNADIIGMFPAGTTQYAFSYINYYGQQSNLFHISSIYYNVSTDKALEVNKTSSDSYTIEIKNLNKKDYQYVRIYSIVRTSQDSTPEIRVVTNYKLEKDSLLYTDRHTTGYTIDPIELFYIGGELLIVGTMALKDNTLFIGDITLKKEVLPEDIVDNIFGKHAEDIEFCLSKASNPEKHDKYFKEFAGDKYYEKQFLLNNPSKNVTTFKKGDYYRFGILFQHKSGRWSEPLWLGDKQNNVYPNTYQVGNSHTHVLSYARFDLLNIATEINSLNKLGYFKARPVIVYPELEDRITLCQGYLCPTVFNAGERLNQGIWALSSWFARPNIDNFDPEKRTTDNTNATYEEFIGSELEYRPYAYIGGLGTRKLELQSADRPSLNNKGSSGFCALVKNSFGSEKWKKEHSHQFFVDSSIITMHSPEIEFNDSIQSLDLSKYKLRIIGKVNLTSHQGDIDLITSKGPKGSYEETNRITLTNNTQVGFFKRLSSKTNYSKYGHRILCSGMFYRDYYLYEKDITRKIPTFYNANSVFNGWRDTSFDTSYIGMMGIQIYPFQCSGSLLPVQLSEDYNVLQYKRLSNARYSYGNTFLNKEINISLLDNKVYNYDLDQSIRINTFLDGQVMYKGNIDSVVIGKHLDNNGDIIIGSRRYLSPNIFWDIDNKEILNMSIEASKNIPSEALWGGALNNPISMRYKSTPHLVLSLNGKDGTQTTLPIPTDLKIPWNNNNTIWKDHQYFWNKNLQGLKYDTLELGIYSYLLLAELYQDNINTEYLFGGTSTLAISNNKWVIAGEDVELSLYNTLYYTEGDTYYQRYDNLKTYPWSMEEVNGITDVISFMVETRINLEGKYDSNKADKPHFHILPSNFNLINKAYTQKNNFFEYYGVDYDRIEVNKYPNLISWSKTKTVGEIIDTWLNMNLSSTLDLDGNNGKITSLQNYNGNILAFLDKSLNQILYNELTLISTQAGVPIEIANSGKVTGYRSISNQIGCSNKWSICLTPNGLYFLDSFNKDLYKLGEGLNNLSNTNGFNSYLRNIPNIEKPWNPQDLYSIKTSYDPINKEVLFSTKDETLSYSELLLSFMSFYDFNVDYFTTLQGDSLVLTNKNKSIYEYQKDKHNYYFGSIKPYSIEFISNPDPLNDKIFNSLEFRSDSLYDDTSDNTGNLANFETFNKLYISNEYLNSEINLRYNKYGLSNLKKKFRIWKTLIPRDFTYSSDRIRNTWTKIKLERTPHGKGNCKTILHDLTVYYSI